MLKIFKTDREKLVSQIAQLEARSAKAQVDAEAARARMGDLVLAVEDGEPGAVEAIVKARKTIERAEVTIAETQAALRVARARIEQDENADRAAEIERLWAEAEKLAAQRTALAKKIESSVAELKKDYDALIHLGIDLRATAPMDQKKAFGVWNPLSPAEAATYFRIGMVKAGFTWAFQFFGALDDVPALLSKVEEGNQWALAERHKQNNQAR